MRKILAILLVAGLAAAAGPASAKPKAECNPRDKDTNNCSVIWKEIGLPGHSGTAADKTAVCHDRYVLSHDNASKTPDWVVELLTKRKLTNRYKRPTTNFSGDLCVPPHGQPDAGDYAKTKDKFEIGHMAPSEDFNNSIVNMRDTFVFSNAVPQAGDKFNAAIWKTLEERVRVAAKARDTLYVITGPIRGNGTERTINIAKADNACGGAIELDAIKTPIVCKAVNKGQATSCDNGVRVPVAIYKIAYDPKRETVFAFVMPNRNHPTGLGERTSAYLAEWRVHVGAVEKLTGLQFFTGIAGDKRSKLIDRCEPTQLWDIAPKPKKKKKKKPA